MLEIYLPHRRCMTLLWLSVTPAARCLLQSVIVSVESQPRDGTHPVRESIDILETRCLCRELENKHDPPCKWRVHPPTGSIRLEVQQSAWQEMRLAGSPMSHVIVVKSPAVTKRPDTDLERKRGQGARKYFAPSPERSSVGQKRPLGFGPKGSASRSERVNLVEERTLPLKQESQRTSPQERGQPVIRAIVARQPHSVAGPNSAIRAEDIDDFPLGAGSTDAGNTAKVGQVWGQGAELDEFEREEPKLDVPGFGNLGLNESGRGGSEQCKTGVGKPGEKVLTCSVGAPHAIMPRRTKSGGRRCKNVADGKRTHADDIERGARAHGED